MAEAVSETEVAGGSGTGGVGGGAVGHQRAELRQLPRQQGTHLPGRDASQLVRRKHKKRKYF